MVIAKAASKKIFNLFFSVHDKKTKKSVKAKA
jgi:hypothetical protein